MTVFQIFQTQLQLIDMTGDCEVIGISAEPLGVNPRQAKRGNRAGAPA
jgi:hypothetical protein